MIRNTHASSRRDRKKCRNTVALFNGSDVSSRCFYADDRRGVVGLYRLDEQGRKFVDRVVCRAAVEWRRGHVRMGRAR